MGCLPDQILQFMYTSPAGDTGLEKTPPLRMRHCPFPVHRSSRDAGCGFSTSLPPLLPGPAEQSRPLGLQDTLASLPHCESVPQHAAPGPAPREGRGGAGISLLPSRRLIRASSPELPGLGRVPQVGLGCDSEDLPENWALVLWDPSSTALTRSRSNSYLSSFFILLTDEMKARFLHHNGASLPSPAVP